MRRKRHTAPLLLLLGLCSASCVLDQVFACSDNASCESGGSGGTCELNGYCSFPDAECDSGQRYGSLAGGGFAGECVEPFGGNSTGPGSTGRTTAGTSSATHPTSTTDAGETSLNPDTASTSTGTVTGSLDASSTAVGCGDWWDCQWRRRRTLTVSALGLSEGLSGFPAPLSLPEDIDITALRVVGPGGELWQHEHDSDVLWVRLPEVPADAELTATLYYDNPDAEDVADADMVWGPEYVAVWHMSDERDASGYGNDATATNVSYASGRVGNATRFDGDTSQLQVPATETLADLLPDGLTISAWILPSAQANFPRVLDKSDTAASTRGWSVLLDQSTVNGRLRFDIGFDEGEQVSMADIPESTGWTHVAVSATVGDVIMVIDGQAAEVSSAPLPVGLPGEDLNLPVGIGVRNNAEPLNVLEGALDEVRISSVRRSPAWIAATFQIAQDGAIALGPEEEVPVN